MKKGRNQLARFLRTDTKKTSQILKPNTLIALYLNREV
jgi:hypothetical protein